MIFGEPKNGPSMVSLGKPHYHHPLASQMFLMRKIYVSFRTDPNNVTNCAHMCVQSKDRYLITKLSMFWAAIHIFAALKLYIWQLLNHFYLFLFLWRNFRRQFILETFIIHWIFSICLQVGTIWLEIGVPL